MTWWNLALNLCVNAPKAELLHFMVTSSLRVLLRNAIVIVTSASSNSNVQHRKLYGDLHETLIIAPYILGDSTLEGNLSQIIFPQQSFQLKILTRTKIILKQYVIISLVYYPLELKKQSYALGVFTRTLGTLESKYC